MSEFLAEAQVLIRPDTKVFRAELLAQIAAATRGVKATVPIVSNVLPGQMQLFATETRKATDSIRDQADEMQKLGADQIKGAGKTRSYALSQGQLQKGAAATALSLGGVRGATLAASGSFLAGAAAVALFAKAVQGAAQLEQELNVFRVTARATADEMERVAEEARRLGADITLPAVSSGDAAQSMTELAKAGLSVRDSLAGARGVLQLSAAAQIGIADATELAASALNAFQLSGAEAVHVADLLANAANNAQGSISDMGLALRQSAAVASLVGISVEDTTVLLTLLAQAGLRGSDAGTSLRVALLRLINPTKAAATVFKQLNINLRDSQGNIRPEVFAEFSAALENLTRKQRQATLALVFGADASRAAALLGRAGADGLNEMRDALDRQGAAAELAGARAQGFSGQMSALSSNLETLGTTLGTVILPALTGFTGILNDIVSLASQAAGGIGKITGAVGEMNREAKESVPVLEQVEDRLKRIIRDQITSALLGGPNVGPRAIIFAAAKLREGSDDIEVSTKEITKNVSAVFKSLQGPIGPSTLNAAVVSLQDMADKLATGDARARSLSREIRALVKEIQTVGGLPASVIKIEARLDKAGAEREGREGGLLILDALTSTMSPSVASALGFDFIENVGKGMKDAAPAAGLESGTILVQSLSTKLAVAQATGGDAQVLSVLREREEKQAAFLQKVLSRPQDAQTQALVRKAAANLEQTQDQIQGILDKQASDAVAAKNDIISARNKADQAILDSIDLEGQRRQNALLAAQSTASLNDDIKRGTQLRNFYKRAIEEVQKTVKDATTAAQQIASLVAKKIAADRQIADAQEELRQARRDDRREARERLRESLALDVQIAQATGNESVEAKARQAEIDRIKAEIRQTRAGSLQRKRLILELRQKQAELKELLGEKEKTNTFAQEAFNFLQTQQGFAANLLGNLIPSSATSGLVGGSQTQAPAPAQVIQAQAAASRQTGPTYGQVATEVDILKEMLRVLKSINGERAHPEARYQRASSGAAMDVM